MGRSGMLRRSSKHQTSGERKKMRSRNYFFIVAMWCGAVMLALPGCSGISGEYRRAPMGAAFEAAKCGQILNPQEAMKVAPVHEMDAATGLKIVEKYRKTFEDKPPATVYNLSIGGIGAPQ